MMPADSRERLSGELVCYARTVVQQEWPQMESGTLGDAFNPWGIALFETLRTVQPESASEQAATRGKRPAPERETARSDRTPWGGG
jgi:hypothetical protein